VRLKIEVDRAVRMELLRPCVYGACSEYGGDDGVSPTSSLGPACQGEWSNCLNSLKVEAARLDVCGDCGWMVAVGGCGWWLDGCVEVL